jgi:putative glutamine amidotransferase
MDLASFDPYRVCRQPHFSGIMAAMNTVIVGISSYLEPARWGAWDTRAVLLHEQYVTALRTAGAIPVLLPPGISPDVLDRLDGLVLAGGADLDPASYGATPDPTTDVPRTDRDTSERNLYLGARERNLPVLGICRGLQIMAVASGGSLHQDLPTLGLGLAHRDAPGTFTDHPARFAPASLAAAVLGVTELTVNSSHHQAVADPGTLTVTGWAADGTVEVCEDPSASYVIGVQWHPEMTTTAHPDRPDRLLFDSFVAAAARIHAAI